MTRNREVIVMEYRGLKIAKDILFNIFLIGYSFLIIAWFVYSMIKEPVMHSPLLANWHISNQFLDTITVCFFSLAKFVLWFYVFVPALAICWTLKKLEQKKI